MRRLPLAFALLGLALVAAPACDWTKFDDLALKTGIRALPRPDDMDSNLYPAAVLRVAKATGSAELLVLGIDNVALADVTIAADGHHGIQTVTNDRFLLGGAKVGGLTTQKVVLQTRALAAYLPDPYSDVPRIVSVLDEDRQPILVTLDSADSNFAVTTLGSPLPIEANAIAVGEARVAGENDVVFSSGTELLVLPNADATSTQSCNLNSSAATLVVGDGWIAAGQPSDPGQAWVVRPDYDVPAPGTCNATPLAGPGGVSFGAALALIDLDGDGTHEVIVSAPGEPSFYYYRSDDASIFRDATQIAGCSNACGTTIAVGTIEGKRTLVIGDPGQEGAPAAPGVVWLLDLDTGDVQRLDRPNDDVMRFGQQVGVVTFTGGPNGPVDLVWVTAAAVTAGDPGVLYLYFWVSSAANDPRVF